MHDLQERLTSENHLIRIEAIEALARRGGPEAVAAIAGALSDAHGGVRTAALYALGALGGPEAIEALMGVLHGGSPGDRQGAWWQLAQMRPEEGIAPLRALLDAPEAGDMGHVIGLLGYRRSPEARALLEGLLEHPEGEVREAAAEALAPDYGYPVVRRAWDGPATIGAGPPDGPAPGALTVPDLVATLADGDYLQRRAAANALGRRRDRSAVAALAGALYDPDEGVRGEAVSALAGMGGPEAIARLIDVVEDLRVSDCCEVYDALGSMPEASPALVEAMAQPGGRVHTALALHYMPEEAAPSLIDALQPGESDAQRLGAMKAIGTIHETISDFGPHLLACTAPCNSRAVRERAAGLLHHGGVGAEEVESVYCGFLADGDPWLRVAALRWFDDPSTPDALAPLLGSDDPSERDEAARGLIGTPHDGKALLVLLDLVGHAEARCCPYSLLRDPRTADAAWDRLDRIWSCHADREVRVDACWALRDLDDRALPLLRRFLDDPDPEIRIDAADELARRGYAAEALPLLLKELGRDDRYFHDAADALACIGTAALPGLRELLAGNDRRLIQRISAIVREMGDFEYSDTPEDIQRALESPDREVRMLAFGHVCEALG